MSAQSYRMVPREVPPLGIVLVPVPVGDAGSNSAAQDRMRAERKDDEADAMEPLSLLSDTDAPTHEPAADPKDAPAHGPLSANTKGVRLRGSRGGLHGGARIGGTSADAGGAYQWSAGHRAGVAGGYDGENLRVSGGAEAVRAVDGEGDVYDGEGGGGSWDGKNGRLGGTRTRGGKTAGGGVSYGESGAAIDAEFRGMKGRFARDGGDTTFGLGTEGKSLGGEASYTRYGGRLEAGTTTDAFLAGAIGDSRYVSRKSGSSGSLGISGKTSAFSLGGSVSSSDVSTASFHTTDPNAPEEVGWGALHPHGARLDDVDDYTDVDLRSLGAGEAYSFDRAEGDGVSGELGVGFASASIGASQQARSRTTIARDTGGDLRVSLSSGDSSTDSMGASGAGVLSAAETETEARGTSASFTARGEAGETAVRGWQETGLLPGVAGVAFELDPEAARAWLGANQRWVALRNEGGYASMGAADAAQMAMRLAAQPLNRAFLERRREGLAGGDAAGITWDEQTTTRRSSSGTSLSLLGSELGSEGVTDTFWDTRYREGGAEKLNAGFEREEDYWSSPTETSRVAVDPKGEVELAMFSEWEAWQESHDALAELGPAAFGLPEEVIEAWRSGELDKGKNTRLMLALGDEEMSRLEKLIGAGHDGADAWERLGGDVVAMRDYMRDRTEVSERSRADRERIRALLDAAVRSRRPETSIWSDRLPAEERETNALCEALAKVNTPEEFAALNDAEKRAVVGTAVIAAARREANPWEALRLVMSLPEGPERNALLRDLFEQVESTRRGSNATIDFVRFVQEESEEAHADPRDILSAVKVETIDPARESREEIAAKAAPEDPSMARYHWSLTLRAAVGEPVKPSHTSEKADYVDRLMGESGGKRVADWMRIVVEREGQGALEGAIRTALRHSHRFLERLNERLAKDPHQRAIVRHLLKGTDYAGAVDP